MHTAHNVFLVTDATHNFIREHAIRRLQNSFLLAA